MQEAMTEVTIEEAKSILENKIERTVITCDGEKLTKQEKIKIKLICLEQMVLGEICLSVLYMVHVFLFWLVCLRHLSTLWLVYSTARLRVTAVEQLIIS